MDTNRRQVLKGMGASGLVIAVPAVGKAASTQPLPTRVENLPLYVMTTHGANDLDFGAGAMSASRLGNMDPRRVHFLPAGLALKDISQLDALLNGPQHVRLIGLVDDANAAVVVNMARAAQVRMHWLAQHRLVQGRVRHTVAAAVDDACCQRLAQGLAAGDRQVLHDQYWTQQLGYALTRLHAQGAPAAAHSWAKTTAAPHAGSFVSFSFDTQGALHG